MADSGNSRKIYLTTPGSGSGAGTDTWIAGEKSHSVDLNANAIDVSDKSSEWDKFIPGNKNWTATAEFNLDNTASAKQKELLQGLVNGTPVKVFSGKLSSNSRSEGIAGDAIVTAVSEASERNNVVSRSVTLQGTGAPTLVFPS